MNAAAIDYIWKAIQESERSDELQSVDDEMLIGSTARRSPQAQPDQSGAVNSEPIVTAVSGPPLADNDSHYSPRPAK